MGKKDVQTWTPSEKVVISSAILGSISYNKTIREGIELAASQLPNRTYYSIQWIWYKKLAKELKGKIEIAKQLSKTRKQTVVTKEVHTPRFDTEAAVQFLESMIISVKSGNEVERLKNRVAELEEILERTDEDALKLLQNYIKLEEEHKELQGRYNELVKIIEQGRQIVKL